MSIKGTSRGGAGAGRGDDPYAADYAKRMGVPKQWVTGPGKAKFSGSIVGFTKDQGAPGQVWFTAESTGGGETDSVRIPFENDLMRGQFPGDTHQFDKFFGVNRKNPSAGKKWVAEGKQISTKEGNEWVNKMHWNLRPHNPEYDD